MLTNSIDLVAAIIGVLLGVFFGVSGFADTGKVDDLSKNQRVKNLLWLIGGAVGVLLMDWKLLSPTDLSPADRAGLVGTYVLSAAVAAGATILFFVCVIVSTIRHRATQKPVFRGRAGEMILEYLSYGYRYYRARLDKLDEEAAKSDNSAASLNAIGRAISTVMATTALDRVHPNREQREVFIDQVMAAIEDTVKLFSAGVENLELRTNYMVKVMLQDLSGAEPLFAQAPVAEYDSFLVLRRYRDGVSGEVCLPLERDANSTQLLPGAPTSAVERSACHLNVAKLAFRDGVSAPTKTAVKTYFRNARYASVLSVPLIWERGVVGVVNVESNHVDLVNKGSDMPSKIGNALAPLCVILGELVHRAEGDLKAAKIAVPA